MKIHHTLPFLAAVATAAIFLKPSTGNAGNLQDSSQEQRMLRVYIGTYTSGKSKGIYVAELNLKTGALSRAQLAAEAVNPSFLAIHPDRRSLYAVGEISDFAGKKSGGVSAFMIDPGTGELKLLNQQPSQGAGPCHLVVDATGRNVLVANYGGGSVISLPVKEHGELGKATAFIQHEGSSVNPQRQKGPHAHSINVDATNRFAMAADLGLDKVLIYRFDADKGTLKPADPPSVSVKPGGGPRHFAFHPNGNYAYTNNEITSSVTAFRYNDATGGLTPLQTVSTLPEGYDGKNNSTAEVRVHPSGKFVYVSNRGHNSIAIFGVSPSTGKLTPVGHESTRGEIPRNFNVDPSGRYLLAANQNTHNVVVFRVNPQTGALTATESEIDVPSPVCIRFVEIDREG